MDEGNAYEGYVSSLTLWLQEPILGVARDAHDTSYLPMLLVHPISPLYRQK